MLKHNGEHIEKFIHAIEDEKSRPLTEKTLLLNVTLAAERTILKMKELKDIAKNEERALGINGLILLGAEFEMISDYLESIKHKLH